ncbi:MAG: carbamoyl-phosphate synthase large subunit [Solirubrobacteraceae bacterium]|nr:carbamoyl-phosphate synthase large subunit [Solirubrobacteraceae bacterium]
MRGLRDQDELAVRLIGVDTTAYSAGLFDCDARYTVPPSAADDFLPALEAICRHERVDVVIPIADFELELFAGAATALQAITGARVITNTLSAVTLARDKLRSAQAVAARGVAVPAWRDHTALEAAGLPVIVKPRWGAGSAGVSVVRSLAELDGALSAAGADALVQDFVAGQEYTVDLVVAPDGDVLATAPRIRAEVRAGQSYKGVTVDDAEIEDAARRCAAALGLTGQGNVQLIRSEHDGRPYFIEVNPKFAAAMGLTIAAGLNLPLLYVKLALGQPVGAEQLRRAPDMWLLRRWEDRVVPAQAIAAVPTWDTVPRCSSS